MGFPLLYFPFATPIFYRIWAAEQNPPAIINFSTTRAFSKREPSHESLTLDNVKVLKLIPIVEEWVFRIHFLSVLLGLKENCSNLAIPSYWSCPGSNSYFSIEAMTVGRRIVNRIWSRQFFSIKNTCSRNSAIKLFRNNSSNDRLIPCLQLKRIHRVHLVLM